MKKTLIGALLCLLASAAAHAFPTYSEDSSGNRYYYVTPETPYYPNYEIRLTSNGVAAHGWFTGGGFGAGSFYGYYLKDGEIRGPWTSNFLFGGTGVAECYGRITSIFYPFVAYECRGATYRDMFTSLVTSRMKAAPTLADISVTTLGAEVAIKAQLQQFMAGDAIPAYYAEIGARWAIHSIRGNDVELELPTVFNATTNQWEQVIVFLQGFLPTLTQTAKDKLVDPAYQAATNVCVDTQDSSVAYCGGKAPGAPW